MMAASTLASRMIDVDEDMSASDEAEWTSRTDRRAPNSSNNDDADDFKALADDNDGLRDFIVDDVDDTMDGVDEDRPRRKRRHSQRDDEKMSQAEESDGNGEGTERSERSHRRNRLRRREIAAVLDDDDLEESTRLAREAEQARARHLFQVPVDETAVADPTTYVCLNPRPEDRKPPEGEVGSPDQPVFVHPDISPKLKPHQVLGAQFLWSHVAVEPNGFGCVLADFMGLGKTLQVITVVQAFLALQTRRKSDGSLKPRHKHVLILAPTICVRNWEAEVVKWLGKKEARKIGVHTLESSREKKMADRVHVVKQWHRRGGLLIMGYELYRILVLQSSGEEKIAAGNSKVAHLIKEVYKCLSDPGPDLIVLDEGHRVRDHKSKLVKALSHVKTARRIILTGYPLQNHLEEYWTMVNFARPDYLGSLEDFKNRFVNPIENGQCMDSTEQDRRLARQRAYVLTNELKTLVLRRDQEYLFRQLPPKKEWVLLCKLTDSQATLYRHFLERGVPKRGELLPGVGGKVDVLGGYHISLAISNHPDVLQETYHQLEESVRTGKIGNATAARGRPRNGGGDDEEDLLNYLAREMTAANGNARRISTGDDDDEDDDESLLDELNAPRRGGGGNRGSTPFEHRLGFARDFMMQYTNGHLESSGKMMILMELLSECKAIDDRVILFSQSIPTLNTIEKMIAQYNRRQNRHSNRIHYLRIDGSTPQLERFRMIGQFNDWEEEIDLIMISTKAGGEGVNLCAGNRIIIFDVCWNPCNDSQSMCRSYRFGQVKPVFVYRFVSAGTMEKKVYDLQIRKEGVAKRIVDEKALERKFKNADLQNYFNIDDFEDAMRQQSTVLQQIGELASISGVEDNDSAEVDPSKPHSDAVAPGFVPGGKPLPQEDRVLETVLKRMKEKQKGWVLDWFEQETMFEETIDDQCTEAEQEEITASYKYVKALRRMTRNGVQMSREGTLLVPCGHCRVPNYVYPESATKVPVPKYIECQYCQRPTETQGALPFAQAQAQAQAQVQANSGAGGPIGSSALGVVRNVFGLPPSMTVDTGAQPPGIGVSVSGNIGGRVLPPHLYSIYQQQGTPGAPVANPTAAPSNPVASVTHGELIRRQLEQQQRELDRRRRERQNMKLGDRHLLVLRRGMNKSQELKRQAQECGATIGIEVNSLLTDIVSAMSLDETLKWLRLTKLPRDVEFHSDEWLRQEIAKEKGLATKPAPAAPSTGYTFGSGLSQPQPVQSQNVSPTIISPGDTSHDTISIDSDSDDDVSVTPATVPASASTTNGASLPSQVNTVEQNEEEDIIEIL